MVNKVVYYIKR